MILKLIGLTGVLMGVWGCAAFPTNGSSRSTKITFSVTMNGPINPATSQFVVLMYLSQNTDQLSQSQEPTPTVVPGSVNGFATGLVTNCVVFDPTNSARPYQIYFFSSTGIDIGGQTLGSPIGNTNDQLPALDINGYLPATWSFSVFLPQLQSNLPESYKSLTYQIIAMNKTTQQGVSGRYMDGIGSPPNFAAQTIRIDSSGSQSRTSLGLSSHTETYPSGGDPGWAIADWNVQVTKP